MKSQCGICWECVPRRVLDLRPTRRLSAAISSYLYSTGNKSFSKTRTSQPSKPNDTPARPRDGRNRGRLNSRKNSRKPAVRGAGKKTPGAPRGELGHTRDTRAQGSHRRTSQPSKPTNPRPSVAAHTRRGRLKASREATVDCGTGPCHGPVAGPSARYSTGGSHR